MKNLLHNALKYYLRYFPLTRGKSRIYERLWRPLAFGQYRREALLTQARVRLHCDLTKFLQRHLYYWGDYEKDQCAFWMRLARRGTVIFDVGANVGLYSLLAAASNAQARIHAFEAAPEIAEALRMNVQLNGMNNIIVNAVGVGRESGTAFLQRLMRGEDLYDGMSFITPSPQASDDAIAMVSLDDYCRQHGITRIDLMKLDIEGGEYDALLGAKNILAQQAVACIFLELVESHALRAGHSTVAIKKILQEAGYRIYALQPRSSGLIEVPLEKVHAGPGDNVIALPRANEDSSE